MASQSILKAWNWMYTINPAPFDYVRVKSLDEVLELLSKYQDDAKIIAGGQSILLLMRKRLVTPKVLIDINAVPELHYIDMRDDYLRIGATITFSEILSSPLIVEKLPLLIKAAMMTADVQVRNRATIGGNLIEAAPGANTLPVLLVTDAQIVVRGRSGEKVFNAGDFFVGPYASAIGRDEVLTEVRIPVNKFRGYEWSYIKVARRIQEFGTLVGATLLKIDNGVIDDVRIAFGNASRKPVRLSKVEEKLIGKRLSKDLIEEVSKSADEGVDVRSTAAASADYRRQLIRVYTKRMLMEIAQRVGVI